MLSTLAPSSRFIRTVLNPSDQITLKSKNSIKLLQRIVKFNVLIVDTQFEISSLFFSLVTEPVISISRVLRVRHRRYFLSLSFCPRFSIFCLWVNLIRSPDAPSAQARAHIYMSLVMLRTLPGSDN